MRSELFDYTTSQAIDSLEDEFMIDDINELDIEDTEDINIEELDF